MPLKEDAIDDLWDVFHPPLEDPPKEDPPLEDPHLFINMDEMRIGQGAHLVLAKNPLMLKLAIERIRRQLPSYCSTSTLTSRIPCLIYGNNYWKTIEQDLDHLCQFRNRSFIGTMNTFVIDCFFFNSAKDAQDRILLATLDGRIQRMSILRALAFYRAFDAGVQSVSQILRPTGIW